MSMDANWADPNWAAPGGVMRLPYFSTPVGNQVVGEQQTAASAATRQAQQSVQITDYTWKQTTTGYGVGEFTIMFDVAFTAEPVVSHGMTLKGAVPTVASTTPDSGSGGSAE